MYKVGDNVDCIFFRHIVKGSYIHEYITSRIVIAYK